MNEITDMVICVEQGILECQSLLLVDSINKNLKDHVKLHAYCPRKNNQPSHQTLTALEGKGVYTNNEKINEDFILYPIANKLLACLDLERKQATNGSILFSDTDTVFLNSLSTGVVLTEPSLFLRPVDNKGPGTEGVNDPNDVFWQNVYRLCGVELPEPSIWTTVRPKLIRNYFNAGFIWAHKLEGFFQQWYDDFIQIIESDLRPFGWTSRDGDDFRCLDQVALAVTATRYQEFLQVLPETYNYPIPFRPIMNNRENHPKFKDLIHVHYHKWFQHPEFLDHVTSDEDKLSEQYQWLKSQLPLMPEIEEEFKC
ncbi:hypothetical protein [Marinicella rhabdoformis]|uniref:hypothetical protein n=1 Tax=Marinicella rhabdoformis TaxID=2580566 RepID=UPI0012AEBEC0|nr:hypothetical protein [Marinicella rhabdoformis]